MKKIKEKKTETIFIQIASYRDPQLLLTLKDCLAKAKYPKNLRFGIAWQHHPDDTWDILDEYIHDERFKILDIDYRDSQGVCWARNLIQSLYANETYTLQLDSHHRFAQDWDIILMTMLQDLQKEGYKKPLITAYIPSFNPDNDPEERVNEPWKMTFDRYIPEGAVFFLPSNFDKNIDSLDKPLLGRFYSAHFAFTLGQFCKEVKHDPNYYFHGEEISIAARAFTHGYDIFYPHKVICWHEYTRRGRSKQWDDINDWGERNNSCHLRNRKLFEMDNHLNDIDFGIYGFGTVRTLKDYEKYAGMQFGSRGVTQELLDHYPPKLSNVNISDQDFNNSLIHIFKHCIDIGYDQVPENDYDFWVVAFKDEKEKDVYRYDADEAEIEAMKKDPDKYYKIWRSFETKTKPYSWLVWPHSTSKGWAEPITGIIP
jgi:hypothetical protein